MTDGEKRYTLQEAAETFYGSKPSKRTLRREFKRYKIPIERLGNKDFCSSSDIEKLRRAIREGKPCPADDYQFAFGCAKPALIELQSGSFSMERRRLALAQARTLCKRLKKPSRNISLADTDPQPASPIQLVSLSLK
jgi:hypothetical protein